LSKEKNDIIETETIDKYIIDDKPAKAEVFKKGDTMFYSKKPSVKRVNFKSPSSELMQALQNAFSVNEHLPADEKAGEIIKKLVLVREKDMQLRAQAGFGDIPDGATWKLIRTKLADRAGGKSKELLIKKITDRRLTDTYNAATMIFTPIKKDSAGRDYSAEQKMTTTKEFQDDPLIHEWFTNEQTGIANKADTSKKNFMSRLYKAMRLMNIKSGQQIKDADGEEDKLDWLAKKMGAVRDYSSKEWAWDPVAKKGKGAFVKKPKRWIKGGESTYYSFVMPVRSFAGMVWGGIPKIKSTSHALAGHVRRHGEHSDVRASPKQIRQIVNCAKDIYENTGNMDPYMYILLGLQTGMRKMEAFTIPFEYLTKFKDGYKMKLYNRKTQHALGIVGNEVADDSKAFHIAIIDEENLVHLITKRMTDPEYKKKGLIIGSIIPKDPDNYIQEDLQAGLTVMDMVKSTGIKKEIKDSQKAVSDNLVTPLRTCYESAEPDEYKDQDYPKLIEKSDRKDQVREAIGKTKKIIDEDGKEKTVPILDEWGMPDFETKPKKEKGEIIYEQRFASGLDEDAYFFKKPLHAVRHMYAQLWLDETDWDYGIVAELGHWKTIKELEDSYGEKPDSIFVKQFTAASKAVAQALNSKSLLGEAALQAGAEEIRAQGDKEKQIEIQLQDAINDLPKEKKKELKEKIKEEPEEPKEPEEKSDTE